MKVAIETYNRLAKVVGGVLTFMGVSLIGAFGVFLGTGQNPLADAAPGFNGPALLVLASIGAFALPLGVSLFSPDSKTSARLRIASGALGLMALLRLAAFASADMRELIGFTPLIESLVLGGIAAAAFFVRPKDASLVEEARA